MQLVITLRKEVDTEQTAQTLLDLVRERLEDHPDVEINAHTSKRLTEIPE